jgi:hypothetical protein
LLADVDTAATSLIRNLQSGDPALENLIQVNKSVNQITLFKQSLSKVCRHIAESSIQIKEENGVEEDALPKSAEIRRPAVLTLTSQTDKGPKHLYSGLQRQHRSNLVEVDQPCTDLSDELEDLDPGNFPNGISVTQVQPSIAVDQISSGKQKRLFSEVFRPHRSLKTLEPPRPSRNATRGSSLGWVNHEESAGSERPTPAYKSDYRYASLPTGSWLHYNTVEASAASASDSKRRQRDRALSFGESRSEAPEGIAEHEQVRTKALFQSAYSSFAPSIDNSAAVVPEETRSQAWWKKVGQKRFQALLALQYPESDLKSPESRSTSVDQLQDDFEAVIDDFDGEIPENPLQDLSQDADPREVDEVLQEISDLLQTLSSYQRIRNLSKVSTGPATPTSAETDVYEILKSNLAILVNSLPPYAVAKLSGDQLDTLNVSTNIVIDTKDHVGTMEQDEYSLQRQRATMAATHPATGRGNVSVGAAGRPGNYGAQSANYNQRLSFASTPRTPYGTQARSVPSYGNTGTPLSQNYPAARPTPMTSQRAGIPAQQSYSNQAYLHGPSAAQFPRPSAAQQNGYGSSYVQSVNSQAFAQQRQVPPTYSYSHNPSPQKAVPSPQPVPHAQQRHAQHQQAQQAQQTQASPSVAYPNQHQAVLTEQARSQLQAQRQLSGTPQTLNINGQYAQMARSSTPGGGTPNGRPAMAAVSGGQ